MHTERGDDNTQENYWAKNTGLGVRQIKCCQVESISCQDNRLESFQT